MTQKSEQLLSRILTPKERLERLSVDEFIELKDNEKIYTWKSSVTRINKEFKERAYSIRIREDKTYAIRTK